MTCCFVDDEAEIRYILPRLCKTADTLLGDLNILPFETVEEASARIEAGGIDAVLLDLKLKGSTRDQTISRLPDYCHQWKLPIFIITADPDMMFRDRAIMLGAEDYIVKNKLRTDMSGFIERVYNMVARHKRDQALKI